MEKYTFFGNYADTIETIEDESDRLAAYRALFRYFREEKMPEGLTGVVKTVIQALSPCIEKTIGIHGARAEAGRKGKRTKSENTPSSGFEENETKDVSEDGDDEDDCPFPEIGTGCVGEESRAFETETALCANPFGEDEISAVGDAIGDMDRMEAFLDKHKIVRDYCGYELALIDWDRFEKAWEESDYLSHAPIATSLKWLARNYKAILGGCYGDGNDPKKRKKGMVSEQEKVDGNPFADVLGEGDDER